MDFLWRSDPPHEQTASSGFNIIPQQIVREACNLIKTKGRSCLSPDKVGVLIKIRVGHSKCSK